MPRVPQAVPFGLSDVVLLAGSRLKAQRDANTEWLLSLDESVPLIATENVQFTLCTCGMA